MLLTLCLFNPVYAPTTQSYVKFLFFVVVYPGIQLANFDATFDCYLNMIGRLSYTPSPAMQNQPYKRLGFLIFILTFTSCIRIHVFSTCSVDLSVQMTFWHFITCYFIFNKTYPNEISSNHHLTTPNLYFRLLRFFIHTMNFLHFIISPYPEGATENKQKTAFQIVLRFLETLKGCLFR